MTVEALTLYYHPRTRAARARWMLEELGAEYELRLVKLFEGEHKKAEYLAIHPLGKVPALQHADSTIFESLGICLYLADRFPEVGLAPALGDPLRAQYCQWMAFSMATLEPVLFALLRDKSEGPKKLETAEKDFAAIKAVFEDTLQNRLFLLGNAFSAADLMNGAMMIWAHGSDQVTPGSAVEQWVERLAARPAYRRAIGNDDG